MWMPWHFTGCISYLLDWGVSLVLSIPIWKLARLELGRSMNHTEGIYAEGMGKTKGLPVIEVADLLHKLLYLMGIHAF